MDGQFPEIEKISRMRYISNSLLSYKGNHFYEDHGYYADSLFLEILQFKLKSGNAKTVLDQPNSIVITEELAIKYFQDPNPIGTTLLLNRTIPLKITGTLSPIPSNSHLNFNFLIPFSTYELPAGYAFDLTSWSWLGFMTYVELKPNSNPGLLEQKLIQHFRELDPENPNPMMPIVQNLSNIYLRSDGMADDLASHIRSGNLFNINALMVVAILILIITGFNFSSLSYALSINRSKSTGIRKVLGTYRKNILLQLITESAVLTLFCFLLTL